MIDKIPNWIARLHWRAEPIARPLALSLWLFAACLFGESTAALRSLTNNFDNVSRLEWPHKASTILAATAPQDRENMAAALLEAIHMKTAAPALLVSTVSEIAHATPEIAASVAAKAVQFQPQFFAAIAAAATHAAPDRTEQIMRSMDATIMGTGIQAKTDQDSSGRKSTPPGKLDPRTLIDHSTNQPLLLLGKRNGFPY